MCSNNFQINQTMLNLLHILFLPSDRGFVSASQNPEQMHCIAPFGILRKIHSCIHDFMADRSSSSLHLFLKKPVKQPVSVSLGDTWSCPHPIPPLPLMLLVTCALLFPSWRPHALPLPIELGIAATSPLQAFCVPTRAGRRPPTTKRNVSPFTGLRSKALGV